MRAQDFYPRQVFVDGEECRLRISLDLNAPIPSVQPNGTLIESTEQPVSVALGQVCLPWLPVLSPRCCWCSCALRLVEVPTLGFGPLCCSHACCWCSWYFAASQLQCRALPRPAWTLSLRWPLSACMRVEEKVCNAKKMMCCAQFTGADGNPLAIKGVNWFGFETDATMVGGLWQVRT